MTPKTYFANRAKDMMAEAEGLMESAERAIHGGDIEKGMALNKLAAVKYNAGLKTMKWATSQGQSETDSPS